MISFKQTFFFAALIFFCVTACKNFDSNTDRMNKFKTEEVKYRPLFHFSPENNWMNDPNGMFFYKGIYHLYFQHNPNESVWGPMHWGHATSKDLKHWEEHSIALYTNHDSEKADKKEVIDFQTQSIAYSLDDGFTWTKYTKNPVLKNPGIIDFRDPKVFWYEPNQKWIMSLAAGQEIQFFESKNLLSWSYLSSFGDGIGNHGGVWECPDLFPIPVNGKGISKWVQLVSINPG